MTARALQIRQLVGQALTRDAITGELAGVLVQRCAAAALSPNPILINQQVTFLRNYIGRVADLFDGLGASARRAGASAQIEPLLEAAAQYFFAPFDVIPDHLGLVGLVDDAYVCSRLLQAASDRHRSATGVPLFSGDLTQENRLARQLIGEPHATQLDAIIEDAIARPAFADAVRRLDDSPQTFDDVNEPWRDDPAVSPADAAMLSALLAGKPSHAAAPGRHSSGGSAWRSSAAATLAALQKELQARSGAGEIKGARQHTLAQVLESLGGMLAHRAPDLDDSIGQAQQVRDLMGRMLQGIAKPSGTHEPAAAGTRLARVAALLGDLKVYLASEVMRQGLSDGEHAAVSDLYVRCGHATTALRESADAANALLDLEVETLRRLALDVRAFASRHHLMVIEPIWHAPPGAQEASAVFFSGGAQLGDQLRSHCAARGFELATTPAARRYAEARWEQLLTANVGVFDLTVPQGPDLAAVCYELGIALSLGRGIVIVAAAGAVIPFDVHIEPISIDPDDPEGSLEQALDAAIYERQFGGGDSSLARTLRHLRAQLGSSDSAQVRQMLELFGAEAEADPILFRARLGSLIGFIGSDAPRVASPAWPGNYPGQERRCFHVMPFGPAWANGVRACVRRACSGHARYLRGDEARDARIIRSIWDEICCATHIVVDITDFNPNVALELGIAHTLGRRTLIVAQRGATIERLFRSIAKLRVHPYALDDLEGTLGRTVEQFVAG